MTHKIRATVPYFPRRSYETRLARMLTAELDFALAMQGRLPPEQKEAVRRAVGLVHQRPYVGGIGVARCRLSRVQGTWELAEDGVPMMIFPARDQPKFFGGVLIDLVAYQPSTNLCFRRTGNAAVLGEWHLDLPPIENAPLQVFSNPCAWARSNASGVVLLDWANAWQTLGHVPRILAPSERFGKELKRRLLPPAPHPPEIFISDGVQQ
jgi:hypothetical protein